MKAKHIFVKGKVQGVGYRYFVLFQAQSHKIVGWVRNLPDSRVEIKAWGEEQSLIRLIEVLRAGPPRAQVDGVEIHEISESVASDEFVILR